MPYAVSENLQCSCTLSITKVDKYLPTINLVVHIEVIALLHAYLEVSSISRRHFIHPFYWLCR